MTRTRLQEAREQFTFANSYIRENRMGLFTPKNAQSLREKLEKAVTGSKSVEQAHVKRRKIVLDLIDKGYYSGKSPISSVDIAILKRVFHHTSKPEESWDQFLKNLAPDIYAKVNG